MRNVFKTVVLISSRFSRAHLIITILPVCLYRHLIFLLAGLTDFQNSVTTVTFSVVYCASTHSCFVLFAVCVWNQWRVLISSIKCVWNVFCLMSFFLIVNKLHKSDYFITQAYPFIAVCASCCSFVPQPRHPSLLQRAGAWIQTSEPGPDSHHHDNRATEQPIRAFRAPFCVLIGSPARSLLWNAHL